MAKIGTAHIEIKPVLDEKAMADLSAHVRRIVQEAVSEAIEVELRFEHLRKTGQVGPYARPAGGGLDA